MYEHMDIVTIWGLLDVYMGGVLPAQTAFVWQSTLVAYTRPWFGISGGADTLSEILSICDRTCLDRSKTLLNVV
jgi:hypothetical protein